MPVGSPWKLFSLRLANFNHHMSHSTTLTAFVCFVDSQ